MYALISGVWVSTPINSVALGFTSFQFNSFWDSLSFNSVPFGIHLSSADAQIRHHARRGLGVGLQHDSRASGPDVNIGQKLPCPPFSPAVSADREPYVVGLLQLIHLVLDLELRCALARAFVLDLVLSSGLSTRS